MTTERIEFGGLIADKVFDSNWIIEDLSAARKSSFPSVRSVASPWTSMPKSTNGAI